MAKTDSFSILQLYIDRLQNEIDRGTSNQSGIFYTPGEYTFIQVGVSSNEPSDGEKLFFGNESQYIYNKWDIIQGENNVSE